MTLLPQNLTLQISDACKIYDKLFIYLQDLQDSYFFY